jgi:hypothetical protein
VFDGQGRHMDIPALGLYDVRLQSRHSESAVVFSRAEKDPAGQGAAGEPGAP